MTKTAFIGLGVMGGPMAGHLAKAGHQVTVYNRTSEKAENWVKEHGGESAPTPAQAAAMAGGAEIVCACVGNDADLRSVVYGDDGILSGMKKGAIFVDHTTASATVAREIDAKAKDLGLGFLDGPVSGGQAGAESGQLTVMVGGQQKDCDTVRLVIGDYAKSDDLSDFDARSVYDACCGESDEEYTDISGMVRPVLAQVGKVGDPWG